MPKASCLQFKNYTVEKLLFETVPIDAEIHEFELHPNFHNQLIDIGNDNYDVELSVDIAPEENHPMPFKLSVSLIGHFSYSDDANSCSDEQKEDILRHNTIAILFPFLRSIVASLTTSANIPPLIMPILNLAED